MPDLEEEQKVELVDDLLLGTHAIANGELMKVIQETEEMSKQINMIDFHGGRKTDQTRTVYGQKL
eukprot:gene7636-11958_t